MRVGKKNKGKALVLSSCKKLRAVSLPLCWWQGIVVYFLTPRSACWVPNAAVNLLLQLVFDISWQSSASEMSLIIPCLAFQRSEGQ